MLNTYTFQELKWVFNWVQAYNGNLHMISVYSELCVKRHKSKHIIITRYNYVGEMGGKENEKDTIQSGSLLN